MSERERVLQFWNDIHIQNWDGLLPYFQPDAVIRWHNTNEQFTVEEYIRANAEYPGDWQIEAERVECKDDLVISAVRVYCEGVSAHATSFFVFREGKIASLDEYWSVNENAPEWRRELHIGRPIRQQ